MRSSITVSGIIQCPLYFWDAQAACFPSRPGQQALMKHQDQQAYLCCVRALSVIHQSSDEINVHFRIISMGTDSSADNTFLSRSSSLDDGGYWRYTRFACPQHCSVKLSSQWNLGKRIASKPLVLHAISMADSWLVKSGWFYSTCFWQQCVAPIVHLKILQYPFSFASSISPCSCKSFVIPLKVPRTVVLGVS
jgi:hypothetical protein